VTGNAAAQDIKDLDRLRRDAGAVANEIGHDSAGLDEFMTVREIAALLRLNPQTVRNAIARGEIRAIRIGRSVRIRRCDFEEMLNRARI
jgi:excisionase family DNA binding protein